MKGVRVFVSRSTFPAADAGEFYWIDLIGLSVFNRDAVVARRRRRPDRHRPALRAARPRAEAARPAERAEERLIPFVEAYVDSVDIAGRRIVVDWGLDY